MNLLFRCILYKYICSAILLVRIYRYSPFYIIVLNFLGNSFFILNRLSTFLSFWLRLLWRDSIRHDCRTLFIRNNLGVKTFSFGEFLMHITMSLSVVVIWDRFRWNRRLCSLNTHVFYCIYLIVITTIVISFGNNFFSDSLCRYSTRCQIRGIHCFFCPCSIRLLESTLISIILLWLCTLLAPIWSWSILTNGIVWVLFVP